MNTSYDREQWSWWLKVAFTFDYTNDDYIFNFEFNHRNYKNYFDIERKKIFKQYWSFKYGWKIA